MRNRAQAIVACDFFVVVTASLTPPRPTPSTNTDFRRATESEGSPARWNAGTHSIIRGVCRVSIHPDTGGLWDGEQGPQGGDEVNIIVPGKNYGWPIVTYGRDYDGTFMTKQPWRADFEAPMVFWVPSIANDGMTFYTGDKFPAWKGTLFVAGMVEARIPNSGQVQRIVLNKDGEIRREAFFRDFRQRIRDVSQSPDGYLYVLTDEDPGGALKIEPAP